MAAADQPAPSAPLALPQNQLSTQHPPLSSVLQQFHTRKRHHHQKSAIQHRSWCPVLLCDCWGRLHRCKLPPHLSPFVLPHSRPCIFNRVIPHKTKWGQSPLLWSRKTRISITTFSTQSRPLTPYVHISMTKGRGPCGMSTYRPIQVNQLQRFAAVARGNHHVQ